MQRCNLLVLFLLRVPEEVDLPVIHRVIVRVIVLRIVVLLALIVAHRAVCILRATVRQQWGQPQFGLVG